MSQEPDASNVLRIMVSTDNHLGVWEHDEWRAQDSFDAFEEVFKIAKEQHVDFVLLGGDLFHDNKPSRNTLVKCLEILNRYCLGDDPIAFQVVSDPSEIVSGVDNTQSETLNIGLPVFTIHGNHDDPAGTENLSAIDILSTIHYVNYFGKHMFEKEANGDVGRITLRPLLIRKGTTKLALYGLGFLREERLARSFQLQGQVLWNRPAGDTDSWFSVFTLHQNRVQHYKTGPGNKARSIRDRFLPPWLDLVIWGHEHESKPVAEPANDPERAFSVLQPGSTVATALSEPESKPKACFILEICEEQWRITRQPLSSVRPFKWTSVSLKDLGAELGNQKQIEGLLKRVVEDLIQESLAEQAASASADALGAEPREPKLPIVRVRVDYTGYSTVHSQTFGQKFINRVANPHDIILWAKSIERKPKTGGESAKDPKQFVPEALDRSHMEDLIAEFAGQLEILPAKDLGEALKRFVEKDEKHVLQQTFEKALKDTQDAALEDIIALDSTAPGAQEGMQEADGGDKDGMDVMSRIHAAGKKLQAEADAKYANDDARLRAAEEAAANGEAGGSEDGMDVDGAHDDDDDEGTTMKAPPARRGRGRGTSSAGGSARGAAASAAKGRTSKAKAASTKNTLDAFLSQLGSSSRPAGRQTQRASAQRTKSKLAAAGLDSDDEAMNSVSEDAIEDDDDDDDVSFVSYTPSQAPPTQTQSGWSQGHKKLKPSQQSTAAMPTANRGRRKR